MDSAKQIIDDLQERHELSDSEIARLCDTSQPTIWRVKNGAVKSCSSDLYIALSLLRKRLGRKRMAKSAGRE